MISDNKIDHRPITVTTLSPIHIGCDEDYVPTNFVIKDDSLYYLDMAMLADVLDDKQRYELGKCHTTDAIQRFFKSNREIFVPLASHIVGVATDIAQAYEERAGQSNNKNQFQIARTAYRPIDSFPYLPGSSLKGSIRTAWLDGINRTEQLEQFENIDEHYSSRKLEQKLLNFEKLQDDPFRYLNIADAHPDEDNAPTYILYAISKKKRLSDRNASELPIFLESVPGLLTDAFISEIRIHSDNKNDKSCLTWQQLCSACNAFYWPQLEAELDHAYLAGMLDTVWKQTIKDLLREEFAELRAKHQGFLLRVGKHSGAESVTLNKIRCIYIKNGKPLYQKQATEKRLASKSKKAGNNFLPFGWLWIESCQDEYQYLSIALRDKLRPHTQILRDAQRNRLEQTEQARAIWLGARQAAEQKRIEEEKTVRREAEAAKTKEAELASMSENMRQIALLRNEIDKRLKTGRRINVNDQFYGGTIKKLALHALENTNWCAEEKKALADMLEDRAGKLMNIDAKDLRKQLKLAALRGQA
ncbi:type III-A CRISPR-associated RAMP protein Csm5 [Nitrosomonas communis]|uniref:CRISPR system Cms protein Csm5 n=1 Tax=Nitrosomonas communis TaxID=44574 RepID=A0A1I4RMV4_9PROT|nr:type III-A CRISPR-associated RAMP protein Csm5 [Nitrosomonas communis]SFM53568.1 CRISPR-associated protein Csm5 [Nitrosomonas communis]